MMMAVERKRLCSYASDAGRGFYESIMLATYHKPRRNQVLGITQLFVQSNIVTLGPSWSLLDSLSYICHKSA